MREYHPFGFFIPPKPKHLLLGSFPGKQSCAASPDFDPSYDWFYRSKRGRFWHIMEAAYELELGTKEDQMDLMTALHMALGDVIASCVRTKNTNSDQNLTEITYSTRGVADILGDHEIETIYFTSSFVASAFRKHFAEVVAPFPKLTFITLPSPSPRYAAMRFEEKVRRYRAALPRLPSIQHP